LHGGGAGADDGDALGGEVDALVRPLAGVVPAALEAVEPLELRNVGGRKAADGGNDEAGRIHLALVGAHGPAIGLFIEHGLDTALAELDVGLEVEALGAMLEIAQDLVLLRIAFGPLPLLKEVPVEGVAIDVTIGVATRTGIAVPVPGTADAMARLDRLD